MSPDEYRIAQMEIAKGISWSLSSIEPKTAVKKDDWDRLVQAIMMIWVGWGEWV